MSPETRVLLVYDNASPLRELELVVREQGVRTCRARTCYEAFHILREASPSRVVFADTELADGNWMTMLLLAEQADAPVSVILVARHLDMKLCTQAVESGAHDVISPPFVPSEVARLLRRAVGDVFSREGTRKAAASSCQRDLF